MADYRLTDSDAVVRVADNAFIPNDPGNRDRAAFEAWLAAGNVADPCVPPPARIPPITKRQALLWLLTSGKTAADVQTAIDSITDSHARAVAQIEWDEGQTFERSHPLFDELGPALGLTTAQIDDAFRAAALL